ncbi:MAG: acetyl-CoA acetyltransferase [Syntrophales bacterium]|jgi:acetyl-CoA C-acetyltransferase|nr:acetyl-CoA acetyltransferase [Syntrophales bacterium]MDD4338120.1 acetyl-CoA acetyltransferase [Syntrophales bacterium]HPB69364.1 acetyl-CoA acetyltransferase [Syntrophales bacterium]HQN25490.1 acetyl-CoA acetyltransferase [Syntrophales bacterium]HQP28209.1 acetyl-CoA acetyltransferase [Syntrophales bacterium]
MATGIRDKVAIIGMGCTKFGERWDCGPEDLMVEAFQECLSDAGIEKNDLQAAWFGSCLDEVNVGKSALPPSLALRLPNIGVTRVENYCASGTEAFRGAVYAVASGAYDICLAIGAEKLKDIGYAGLPEFSAGMGLTNQQWFPNMTAPGCFAMLASGYSAKYGVDMKELKRAMAHVSAKSHANGALNPKAHLRAPVTEEVILKAPMIAYPLGLFDCCGVSDGSACAIVATPEVARRLGKKDFVTVKALQMSLSNGEEMSFTNWDGSGFVTTAKASAAAYREAGIVNPREEISMMEVHDCFSITELVTMEDLHISARGEATKDIMDGFYDLNGKVPCQVDGGLKCFGHPIGASGLRMIYEMYLQFHGRAGQRQLENPRYGLTHNLGGFPFMNVCSIAIVGRNEA